MTVALGRGFKTKCENISLQVRRDIGLRPVHPLPAPALASHLGVELWTSEQIEGLAAQHVHTLLVAETHNWSAVAVEVNSRQAVIVNPTHSAGRRCNDVMHELSHLLMGHSPSIVFMSPEASIPMRSYDLTAEHEAAWLSGCLLLPGPAALAIVNSKIGFAPACTMYVVSAELLRMRIQWSGVVHR